MRECFVERNFSEENVRTIVLVNMILDEYRKQGFRLSLRQLYYQLVSRDYIPNTQRSYKNLGNLVSHARQAGRVDWEMIEDRNRETIFSPHWDTPADIIRVAAKQFIIDKWQYQPQHVEVMVEKDALSGVLGPVCRELDIRITANKGYSSSSTMYEIGKRLQEKAAEHKLITILYLGDHDPSGIDMTRDVADRLRMYAETEDIEVERLALNMGQINLWKPPENPAKETDARFSSYRKRFGDSSWELDAIEPANLAQIVRNAVLQRREEKEWDEAVEKEQEMRDILQEFADEHEE